MGKAIARRLGEAGANVLIGDRNADLATVAAAELNTISSGKVIACPMDVGNPASVVNVARRAEEEFGCIDIWVNNAGVFPSVAVAEMSDEAWDNVFNVNSRGTFIGSREAIRSMTSKGTGGVIVNVASLAGLRGIAPGLVAYVSSKHAVVGMTKQMALECAPQGIRVLAVAPSFMVTEGNLGTSNNPSTYRA